MVLRKIKQTLKKILANLTGFSGSRTVLFEHENKNAFTLNINVNGLMKVTRETKGVIYYNVIKIMAPLCTLVHL
jgi:hypothetical protein